MALLQTGTQKGGLRHGCSWCQHGVACVPHDDPSACCCACADTEMAAEVEPSMETAERLAAEAEATALRQARLRFSRAVRVLLGLRALRGTTYPKSCCSTAGIAPRWASAVWATTG